MLLSNPYHPCWGMVKFLAVCAVVTVVMWKNASNFDITEYKAIAEIAIIYFAGQYGIGPLIDKIPKRVGKGKDSG